MIAAWRAPQPKSQETDMVDEVQHAKTVVLRFVVRQEEDHWFGQCVELGTAADGPSVDAVLEKLRNLVELTLDGLTGAGQLERVFRERNIPIYLTTPDVLTVAEVPVSQAEQNAIVTLQALPWEAIQQPEEGFAVAGV